MRKNQTMITPCSVKARLYPSFDSRSPSGVRRSARISAAAAPPMKKKNVTDTR